MPKAKRSPANAITELALEIARKKGMSDGTCGYCKEKFDPAVSTARFSTIFCTLSCEHQFIREGLRSLTVEDCIRIQKRAEELLRDLRANEPQA